MFLRRRLIYSFLNLENNKITDEKELYYVIGIGCRIAIRGNDVSGASLGLFY